VVAVAAALLRLSVATIISFVTLLRVFVNYTRRWWRNGAHNNPTWRWWWNGMPTAVAIVISAMRMVVVNAAGY
jgi:hypothetical protein